MTEEIIIAGFGGQGVLSMGKILAYSGIMQDQEDPYGKGWIVKIKISDETELDGLLNADAYKAII